MGDPTFLIIGAQKCGTTSLHYYAGLHPEISVSARKETDFFVADRTPAEYARYARSLGDRRARGEASPSYTMDPVIGGVPGRIHAACPGVRLIYVVGDPVDRVGRAYREARATGGERRAWGELLASDEATLAPLLAASLYGHQLARYLRFFELDSFLFIDQDELRRDRDAVLERLFQFIGVDPGFRSPHFAHELNTREDQRAWGRVGGAARRGPVIDAFRRLSPGLRRPFVMLARTLMSSAVAPVEIDPDSRALLAERIAPDLERFRQLTGRSFAGWSL